ncbi:MPDZ isoform 16, partial [Pan troglodytes]
SASKISQDVDKEDEFGYSWSKLCFCDAFNCKRY